MEPTLNSPDKVRVMRALFAVFVLLAIYLAFLTFSTIKQYSYIGSGTYAVNTITVSGKGEVFAIPDTGTFSFSVDETGKTVAIAQDTASKKMNSILDALKGMGIDEKDIKTTGYNSNPKYEYQGAVCTVGYCPPGKQILNGYEVIQTVTVKVRKTADAGAALTKVGDLGASNISGLSFVTDNMDTVQADARDKAIQDAKAKADVLVKSLGVKIVRIVNFSESGSQPTPYYGMAVMAESKAVAPDVATPPQLPTGENDIVSNVTITYEIK